MRSNETNGNAAERCLIAPDELRWTCDPGVFRFETTSELGRRPIEIIGQPRALEALRLGLDIRGEGYNIFVAGDVGTGRSTIVRQVLKKAEREGPKPDDLVYVHNFRDPDRPRLLRFSAGQGREFRDAVREVIEGLGSALPRVFDSEAYENRRRKLIEETQSKHRERIQTFEARAKEAGFAPVQVQVGEVARPDILPVIEDEPVDLDDLESKVSAGEFDRDELERLRAVHVELTHDMNVMSKELRQLQRELRRAMVDLDRRYAEPVVRDAIDDLREIFGDDAVGRFLDAMGDDLLERISEFRELAEDDEGREEGGDPTGERTHDSPVPPRYEVNLLVDNHGAEGRPILRESAPSWRNLFGTIDSLTDSPGDTRTDHTRIKAGSLPRANGGVLVLDAMDVLAEPGVWPALKRTLRTGELEIQAFDPRTGVQGGSLQPEPIPLDVKVVLVGTKQAFNHLYALDEDFKKIFKIKADFAARTPVSPEELDNYASFVQKKCLDDALPPFSPTAVAAIVEHGVRLGGRRGHLTTHFDAVADLIRESGYWARREDDVDDEDTAVVRPEAAGEPLSADRSGEDPASRVVEARHVDLAIEKRRHRLDLLEESLRERVIEGTRLIELEGSVVGQVNGLVVLDVGDFVFGQPSRITAVTAMGRMGLVDIERESELGGVIHTKGVFILSGFLRERFARDKPLTLSASLCFEQSYGPVDGDSASCAELFALVSSLSGVPLRQSVAVTGSIDQRGVVQPVGGANEKVEGFFDLCVERGLDGDQGVILPRRNLNQLMLRKDVVDSVRAGMFRVWGISTVEEGLEILTGSSAGEKGEDGTYPADSVLGRTDRRLSALARGVLEYGAADLPLES